MTHLKDLIAAFFKAIFKHRESGLERYLAASVDIYEVEYRQRNWMRMSALDRSFWGPD
jgi:hypothetical protein